MLLQFLLHCSSLQETGKLLENTVVNKMETHTSASVLSCRQQPYLLLRECLKSAVIEFGLEFTCRFNNNRKVCKNLTKTGYKSLCLCLLLSTTRRMYGMAKAWACATQLMWRERFQTWYLPTLSVCFGRFQQRSSIPRLSNLHPL